MFPRSISLTRTAGRNPLRPQYQFCNQLPRFQCTSTELVALETPTEICTITKDEEKSTQPKEIVKQLEKYIIGQEDAKKSFSISFRNRWRRKQLNREISDDIIPSNLLLMGPTGVGKSELARRMAKITKAPFVRVEATRYTEVGYKGQDVDQMIVDLLQEAIRILSSSLLTEQRSTIELRVEDKLVNLLALRFKQIKFPSQPENKEGISDEDKRKLIRNGLRNGSLENVLVEYSITNAPLTSPLSKKFTIKSKKDQKEYSLNLEEVVRAIQRKFGRGRVIVVTKSVKDLREMLIREEEEAIKSTNSEDLLERAKKLTEEEGIVFIDEIDKVCQSRDGQKHSSDASGEGVQRDLLSIIEGCDVSTPHGNVNTKNILFIASGSFYACKPSDMLPELQGRLPVKVELKHLTEKDFARILSEPKFNLLAQQAELFKAENITLSITPSAIDLIAQYTHHLNTYTQNLGARRLHTVVEKLFEDISFNCDEYENTTVLVDDQMVKEKLKDIIALQENPRKYIL